MTHNNSLVRFAYFLITVFVTVKLIACRGTVPESVVTDTQRSPIGPVVDSAEAGKPQIIERLIIKPKSLPLASFGGLRIEVRSESEIWCERRCSEFSLLEETTDGGSLRLSAVKKTLMGHTTPGVLDVQQDLEMFGSARKKLEIMNVGVKGERVTLSPADFDEVHPNFFALPMTISNVMSKGSKIHKARFDDRDVEILLAPGCILPDAGPVKVEHQAFVMGSYFEERVNAVGEKGVFIAKKIIYPWP
jgi:hypothetical protein